MNFITNTFEQNMLLFKDTDSLVYEIETNDVYEDFYEDKNLFDFSNYPEDSNISDLVNKTVIGKVKDEVKGKIISEFVGLKSKMYSVVIVNNGEIKKAKGVKNNVVKNIRHKEYLDVLFNKYFVSHKMKSIQSKLHRIRTSDVFKIFDKKYILDDNVNS